MYNPFADTWKRNTSASTNLTYEQYLRWEANPTVNPKTGRSIEVDGPTYNKIKEGYGFVLLRV